MAATFDPNRWTRKTQEAVQQAMAAATDASHPEVTPDHLLAALLGQADGVVLPLLEKAGVPLLPLRNQVGDALSRLPRAYGSQPQLSAALRDVVAAADHAREQLGDDYLSTEHLLLALADRLSVSQEQLLTGLQQVRGSHRVTSQDPEETYQALEKYGRDLTEQARKGKLDPVIGRDEEIGASSRCCPGARRTTRS